MTEQEETFYEEQPQLGEGEDPTATGEQYLDEEDMADNQDRMENQQEDIESMEWADVPQQKRSEGLYTLFNKVLKTRDNSKVGNLDKTELGPHQFMTVRGSQFLCLVGNVVHHKQFANFFNELSEITLKTSASKKGWFTELFVSQKKQTTRFSGSGFNGSNSPFGQQQKKKRFNLFGGSSDQSVEQQQ